MYDRHHLSMTSASAPSAQSERRNKHTKSNAANFDVFVSSVYFPHAKVRKRS